MRRWIPLLLAGCANDPVPDDLTDPIGGLWSELGRADAELWALAVLDVLDRVDPTAPSDGQVFRPEPLPAAALRPDGGPLPGVVTRTGALGSSPHDVDAWRRATGLTDQGCQVDAGFARWTRTYQVPDCWGLGACRDALATSEVERGPGALTLSERAARLDVDGRSLWVLLGASSSADPAWSAYLHLSAWAEDPDDSGSTRWLRAAWEDRAGAGEADLTASLLATAGRAEAFLDDGVPTCEDQE